jgi:hypothetical protein
MTGKVIVEAIYEIVDVVVWKPYRSLVQLNQLPPVYTESGMARGARVMIPRNRY